MDYLVFYKALPFWLFVWGKDLGRGIERGGGVIIRNELKIFIIKKRGEGQKKLVFL